MTKTLNEDDAEDGTFSKDDEQKRRRQPRFKLFFVADRHFCCCPITNEQLQTIPQKM